MSLSRTLSQPTAKVRPPRAPMMQQVVRPPVMTPNTLGCGIVEESAKRRRLRFHQELARAGECHSLS